MTELDDRMREAAETMLVRHARERAGVESGKPEERIMAWATLGLYDDARRFRVLSEKVADLALEVLSACQYAIVPNEEENWTISEREALRRIVKQFERTAAQVRITSPDLHLRLPYWDTEEAREVTGYAGEPYQEAKP